MPCKLQKLKAVCWKPWLVTTVPAKSSKDGEEPEVCNLKPGDVVKVQEGDLADLKGKVISVDGVRVTIMPKHEDLKVCVIRFV